MCDHKLVNVQQKGPDKTEKGLWLSDFEQKSFYEWTIQKK